MFRVVKDGNVFTAPDTPKLSYETLDQYNKRVLKHVERCSDYRLSNLDTEETTVITSVDSDYLTIKPDSLTEEALDVNNKY